MPRLNLLAFPRATTACARAHCHRLAPCCQPNLALVHACPMAGQLTISIPTSPRQPMAACRPRCCHGNRQFSKRPSSEQRTATLPSLLLPRRLGAWLAAAASCHMSITAAALPVDRLLSPLLSVPPRRECQPLFLPQPPSQQRQAAPGWPLPFPPVCLSCSNTVVFRYPKDESHCPWGSL